MRFRSSTLLLLPTLAVLLCALSGCENWPLYLHLPDPNPEPIPTENFDVDEDTGVEDGELQDLGEFVSPSQVVIRGSMDSCGFDINDHQYDWPLHPVDSNGDGEADTQASVSGWYSGDVDLYGVTADGEVWLSVTLEWDRAPLGGLNAPYRPASEDTTWEDETDLDFVVFSLDAAGDVVAMISDAGYSRDHPATTPQLLWVEDSERRGIAVGCHHEVPSGYTLTLDLLTP